MHSCLECSAKGMVIAEGLLPTWDEPVQWLHNERDGVSNHRRINCLPNPLSRCRSKKTSKLLVTGLCEGNSPVTGEFPAQRASNAENVSIWWRHHALQFWSYIVGYNFYTLLLEHPRSHAHHQSFLYYCVRVVIYCTHISVLHHP